MNKKKAVKLTEDYVKAKLADEPTGHDWWHSWRVRKMASKIQKLEGGDKFVIELAALLHDIADWKFQKGNDNIGSEVTVKWLKKLKLDKKTIKHISEIIRDLSFKGVGVKSKIRTLEGRIVQDADRLDAMGAIGIARVFAYGGYTKRNIYEPGVKPVSHKSFRQYKTARGSSINHFYEKLLHLRDLMNTRTAKKIAQARHAFLLSYLKEFFSEWKVEL